MRMTPLLALKKMVGALSELPCHFCLIGGHAASLYRSQERFTKDVDFAIVAHAKGESRAIAERAIKSVGMKASVGFIPLGSAESSRKAVCLITSKPLKDELTGLVDILLPKIPWVSEAVERAQNNLIDLGFAKVPVITPEDLIIAKSYAVRNSPDRFQDLDDLKHVFQNVKDLDTDYIRRKLEALGLHIPSSVASFAPESIV